MSDNYNYFMVESGRELEIAKRHVATVNDAHKRNVELIKPLGAEKFYVSFMDGVVCGVIFDGKGHKDFKKPDRKGVSYPKAKSEWAEKFAANKGYDKRGFRLAEELGVPTDISYTYEKGSGRGCIASGFDAGVGFLWLTEDGPFALYVVDVQAKVKDYEDRGYVVDDVCKNFRPQFGGCRPILKEEWELVVAKHKLEQKFKEAA